jgi:hypothetical protein
MGQDDELTRAYREGRLSRRAFVRQQVDRGMEMPAALALADEVVPRPAEPAGAPAAEAPPAAIPATPRPAEGLEVTVVHDGYVVYDTGRDRMHSLNHTAAVVFELCNGTNDEPEITRRVQQAYALREPPTAETRRCLETFLAEGLIR